MWDVQKPEEALDDLFDESTEAVETEQIETKDTVAAVVAPEIKLGDESDLDNLLDESEEEIVEEVGEEEPETPKAKTVKKPVAKKDTVNSDVLNASADYIAKKLDIELPEGIEEWTEENFADFLDEAIDFKIDEKYNLLKSSDEVTEAILNIKENGGDESAIISLFKEQREFNSIDTSTAKGKLEKIKRYYTEVDGKSEEWFDKRIAKKLIDADDETELNELLEEVNKDYDDYVSKTKTEQVDLAKRQKIQREQFLEKQQSLFSKVLEAKKIPKKEIEENMKFVYDDKAYTLKASGKLISALDLKILEAKNNPELLADVALFFKDKKAYDARVITEASNAKVEKRFSVNFKSEKTSKATEELPKKVKLLF